MLSTLLIKTKKKKIFGKGTKFIREKRVVENNVFLKRMKISFFVELPVIILISITLPKPVFKHYIMKYNNVMMNYLKHVLL